MCIQHSYSPVTEQFTVLLSLSYPLPLLLFCYHHVKAPQRQNFSYHYTDRSQFNYLYPANITQNETVYVHLAELLSVGSLGLISMEATGVEPQKMVSSSIKHRIHLSLVLLSRSKHNGSKSL